MLAPKLLHRKKGNMALRGRKRTEDEQLVLCALRRRGLTCRARHHGAIVPNTAAGKDELYKLLGRYSFRLFLRDLIRLRTGARLESLTHYCSLASVERFVAALAELDLVQREGQVVHLRVEGVHSFGPTLEWYVAEVLRREFGMASVWGLRPGKTAGGGDYDVVAVGDGALLYVEVKSAAPRNIEATQIRAFVQRLAALAPDMAIFLEDTQLRMLDKLVPAIRRAAREVLPQLGPFRRVRGEIFASDNCLFVANSEPDLATNVGVCLQQFLRSRSFVGK